MRSNGVESLQWPSRAPSPCWCPGLSHPSERASDATCECASRARTAPRRSGADGRRSRRGCCRHPIGPRSSSGRGTPRSRHRSCGADSPCGTPRSSAPASTRALMECFSSSSTGTASATMSSHPAGRPTNLDCATSHTTSPRSCKPVRTPSACGWGTAGGGATLAGTDAASCTAANWEPSCNSRSNTRTVNARSSAPRPTGFPATDRSAPPTSTTARTTTRAAMISHGRGHPSTPAPGQRSASARSTGPCSSRPTVRPFGTSRPCRCDRSAPARAAGRSSTSARTSSADCESGFEVKRETSSPCATPRCSSTASSRPRRCVPPRPPTRTRSTVATPRIGHPGSPSTASGTPK